MLALALALSITQAGCFGSFNLTRTVWKFNKSVSGDKFIQELVFILMIIVPVYEIATLGDAIVVNSIEFWTGSNPVRADAGEPGEERLVRLEDGTDVRMAREGPDGIRLEREGEVLRLRKVAGAYVAEDELGNVISMVREADGGAIERLDSRGVHRVEAWEIGQAGSDPAALAALAR